MTIGELWRRLLVLVRRDASTRDLEDEMRLHLALRAEQFERSGMSATAAATAARRRFGNLGALVETSRDGWGTRWLDIVSQDARYAARGLRRNPVFSTVVVLTLTLGLGVNAAVFSLLDQLFRRAPSGVATPETVRRLYVTQQWGDRSTTVRDIFNYPAWQSIRSSVDPAIAMSAYASDTVRLGAATEARFVAVSYTDSSYWSLLNVHPQIGRSFAGHEATIEAPANVVIVSDAFWRTHLGARPDVLGETLELGQRRYSVIGVAPRDFTGVDLESTEIWLPLGAMPIADYGPGRLWYQIYGAPRLHVLLRAAPERWSALRGRFTTAFRDGLLAAGYRPDTTSTVSTGPVIAALGPMAPRQEVLISSRLAWVSILVLLIACVNVTNLLLARLLERRREIAVRLALGVSRARLATQLLVESVLLGAIAGGCAVTVGGWAGALLRRILMPDVHWGGSTIEPRLAIMTGAAAVLVSAVVGVAPITQVRRLVNADALKSGTRSTPHAGRRMRGSLVAVQTALAVVLLAGAALFIQSLRRVLDVNLGYDAEHVVFAEPALIGTRGGEETGHNTVLRTGLIEAGRRLAGMPGVEGVAFASHAPMAGTYMSTVRIPGVDSVPTLDGNRPALQQVSSEYWHVIGIDRALRGRLTTDADVAGAPLVVVINESMARTIWPDREAVGQCIETDRPPSPCRTIVGVVPDVHQFNVVEQPRMQYYLPLDQASSSGTAARPVAIIVRAASGRTAFVRELLRRTLTETLPNADLHLADTPQLIEPQLRPWRIGALLFSGLGLLALVVTAIGLYGVLAYGVRGRTRELGIRVALGARRDGIARMIVAEGVRLAAFGLVAGLGLAFVAVRALGSLIYGTSLRDPAVVLAVVVAVLATAVFATLVPALRAASVDPLVALQSE